MDRMDPIDPMDRMESTDRTDPGDRGDRLHHTGPLDTPLPLAPRPPGRSHTLGIVLIVAGVLAILLPLVVGVAITAVVGWLLLLAGAAHLVYGWLARGSGAVLWQVLIGVLYLVVGFFLILHPQRGLATLTLLLAAYFVVEGVVELILYARLRRGHRAGWFLWDGLITLVLGLFIWTHWPISSAWVLGTIVGISLLVSGITRLSFRPGRPSLLGAPGAL